MTLRSGRTQCLLGATLLLVVASLGAPAGAQEPPPRPGPTPAAPAAPPETVPAPVPVLPEAIPNQPPGTVPSTPQRVLPREAVSTVPTAVFQFQPSVMLLEEYTDNFNLDERDKEGNLRSSLSPGLRLLINSPLTKGSIGYTFSPTHDSSNGDISFFHALVGQVAWQANPRWTLTLADTFTRSDQPAEADRLALRRERETFSSNTASISSDYLIARVATRLSYQMSIFSDDDQDTKSHSVAASAAIPIYELHSMTVGYDYFTSDTSGGTGTDTDMSTNVLGRAAGDSEVHGHQLTVSGRRQFTSTRAVGVRGSYALRSLKDQFGDTDYQIWNAAVFTEFVLPARLTLRGSAGISGLHTDSGETLGPGFSSSTSLTYQFGPAVLTVAIDRGFSETFSSGEDFGVVKTEGATAALGYAFTPLLSGTVSGSYRRTKSTGLGNAGGSFTTDEKTTSWGGTVGFSWRPLRLLSVDINYSYTNQSSDGPSTNSADSSYTENRARLGITLNF